MPTATRPSPTAPQVIADVMDPARARALHVALGCGGPPPEPGTALPPFFHQIYFWDPVAPAGLGRDGHPKRGGLVPDLGLPRRMWAGGRLSFAAPLLAGTPAEKQTEVLKIARKTGRSGPLAFVTLRHRIFQDGRLCLSEEQDIVYREDPSPDAPEPAPVAAPPDSAPTPLLADATLLFRYSALTFNGHRIHYDAVYAREVEGYDNLVVHGPLLAQLLMLEADRVAPLKGFSYRALRALTLGEAAMLNRDGARLWLRNGAGQVNMQAEAAWAD